MSLDELRVRAIMERWKGVLKDLADPDNPAYLKVELDHAVEAAIMFQEQVEVEKKRVEQAENLLRGVEKGYEVRAKEYQKRIAELEDIVQGPTYATRQCRRGDHEMCVADNDDCACPCHPYREKLAALEDKPPTPPDLLSIREYVGKQLEIWKAEKPDSELTAWLEAFKEDWLDTFAPTPPAERGEGSMWKPHPDGGLLRVCRKCGAEYPGDPFCDGCREENKSYPPTPPAAERGEPKVSPVVGMQDVWVAVERCQEAFKDLTEADWAQLDRDIQGPPTAPDLLAVVREWKDEICRRCHDTFGEQPDCDDCPMEKLDTLAPQRVRVVEEAEYVGPYSGEGYMIRIGEELKPGTPVKVLIEEESDE
jgi:hypothetical protein